MSQYRKISSLKSPSEFREYLAAEKIDIPLDDTPPCDASAALAQPLHCGPFSFANRWAILPMEGWDCQRNGTPSELTRRRWLRFAESGAKLLYGTEAAAVMHAGRSNPNQLMIAEHTAEALTALCREMRETHRQKFGAGEELVIGLQLTHSGRYSHPDDPHILASRTAYTHPLLDRKFGNGPENIVSDAELEEIISAFIQAATIARRAGFDFVDIKHAHGYLGHELLSAYDRPGSYGGSFENRTRFFREIADGIRKACPDFPISARLSLFDILPFVKGADGIGMPMQWMEKEYPYAFGGDGTGLDMDENLQETVKFVDLLMEYGVQFICATVGSPYYNVHLQRPAYYPVCDGYEMPQNPLYNVARHLKAVQRLKQLRPAMKIVGSGYSCLQEFLPHVAEYTVAKGWTDWVGIGRMVLSYPDIYCDMISGKPLDRKRICRTFGDCTNAPRCGFVSGCYPLDQYYKLRPEAEQLKTILKNKS